MLNGKFFTGLPPTMLNRSSPGNADRFKSNFFWPDDEVDSSSSNQSGTRKNTTKSKIIDNETNDVRPKELFHKQLTSKIGFYDTDNSPYKSTIQPKTTENKTALNNRHSERIQTASKRADQMKNENLNGPPILLNNHQHRQNELKNSNEKFALKHIQHLPENLIKTKKSISNQNLSRSVENVSKFDTDIRQIDNFEPEQMQKIVENVHRITLEKEKSKKHTQLESTMYQGDNINVHTSDLKQNVERSKDIQLNENDKIYDSSHQQFYSIHENIETEIPNFFNKTTVTNREGAGKITKNSNETYKQQYSLDQHNSSRNHIDRHRTNNIIFEDDSRYDNNEHNQALRNKQRTIQPSVLGKDVQLQEPKQVHNEARARAHKNLVSNIFFNN